jgi:hypothetical protein
MIKRAITIALGLCFLVSCGSSFRVMAGYKRIPVGNRALGILLIKKNMQIASAEEVRQFIGGFGSAEDNLYDFFGEEFPAKIKSHSKFKRVCFARGADAAVTSGESQTYDYSLDASIAVPPRRFYVSDTLDYLLVVDMLNTRVDRRQTAQAAGAETSFGGLGGADHLVQNAAFVLWDNRAGAVAVYGSVKESISLYDPMTRDTWVEMLDKIAETVCKGIPFGK